MKTTKWGDVGGEFNRLGVNVTLPNPLPQKKLPNKGLTL